MGFVDRRQTNITCKLRASHCQQKRIAAADRQLVDIYQMELHSDLGDKHLQLLGRIRGH